MVHVLISTLNDVAHYFADGARLCKDASSSSAFDGYIRFCEELFLSTQRVLSRSELAGMSAGALLQDVFWSLWSSSAWALRSVAGPYPEWVAPEATMSSSEQ